MNDFTKEELNELLDCIGWKLGEGHRNPNITFSLEKKIQSMIDNYCEHKNIAPEYSCIMCYECGKRW